MENNSFFDTYKDLFEYEEFVGTEDPVSLYEKEGIGAKTFLDKYRECEQRQAMELRAAFQMPLVSSLMVRTMPALSINFTPTVPLSSTMAIHRQQREMVPHIPASPPSKASSFTRSRLESSLRQSLNNQDDEDAGALHLRFTQQSTAHEVPRHEKDASSPTKHTVSMPEYIKLQQPSRPEYHAPKMSDLLIDNSARSAMLRHRHLDEGKKIELLIGGNFGGRISTVSSNLPPSIKRRLQWSVRVDQRREQPYAVLRREYDALTCQR
ncbi:hypothetical protein FI667_g1102, partial [Globisporangium splendens]